MRCRICGNRDQIRVPKVSRILSGKEEPRCVSCIVYFKRVRWYCKLRAKLGTTGLVAQCIAGLP